jgi:dienelactone hydrolase
MRARTREVGDMNITTEPATLESVDGAMPCHLARPAAPGRFPAVIVVMESFGLNGHIRAVVDRIAGEGYVALAPDLYYRFGSPVIPYDEVPRSIEWMRKLEPARVMADIGVAIACLKGRREVRGDRVGIVGFCMGGTVAFRTAADYARDIVTAVSFYGGGSLADDPEVLRRIGVPLLALWGEQDELIPLDRVQRIEETLRRVGTTYTSVVYPGAGHGFFCDERVSYNPAAAVDAWSRLMRWLSNDLL